MRRVSDYAEQRHNRLAKKKYKKALKLKQVSVTSKFSTHDQYFFLSFIHRCREVTVGLGCVTPGNVTLTTATATLDPFSSASSSSFFNVSTQTTTSSRKTVRLLPKLLAVSVRTHWGGRLCPQLAVLRPSSSGVGALLRTGEPTEAMRLPQLNTCHPPLLLSTPSWVEEGGGGER